MYKNRTVYEEFDSISDLLKTIDSRPNSHIMRDEHSSHKENSSWSGTNTYEEATELLRYGYLDKVGEIQDKVRENAQALTKSSMGSKRMPRNMPIGFVPHVPNALQNKPDSMINIPIVPQKRKTIEIIYAIGANCGVDSDDFFRAGVSLVSALSLIERNGIRTKLSVCFISARSDGENAVPTLKIKDYGENFNFSKICFPLIHTAMFRRIGFKWLETTPEITESGWACGYGRTIDHDELVPLFEDKKNTYVMNLYQIRDELDYDVDNILDYLEVKNR